MTTFTEEQNSAFNYKMHISVNANAGSGKTQVLTERYLRIILKEFASDNKNIHSVVAITFTRLAAQEMKTRIIKRIENLINDFNDEIKEYYQTELNSLKSIREKISAAPILTIHSFCNILLREFPIEAGISPNYTELDEYDSYILKQNIIDEVIEDVYFDISSHKRSYEFISKYGVNPTKEYLKSLTDSKEKFNEIFSIYCQESELLCNQVDDFFLNLLYDYFGKLKLFRGSPGLEQVKPEDDAVIISIINQLEEQKLGIDDFINFFQLIDKFKISRKNFTNAFDSYVSNNFPKFARHKIKDLIRDVLPNRKYQNQYFEDVKVLVNLGKSVLDKMLEYQHDESKYDFDDSMILTLEMLERNDFDVRSKIASRIKYLMVDEFQDTNELQYRIIRNIISALNENSDKNSISDNNLFIVGDPKQSIYGFRSADVKVFGKATDNIVEFNKSATNEPSGDINLSVTFRLRPILIAFINTIFGKLMSCERDSEYDVNYSPFICGRMIDEMHEHLTNTDFLDERFGSIHYLFALKENENELNEIENQLTSKEDRLIINFITKVANGEINLTVKGDDGTERTPNLADIAILCRKKKSITKLAQSFNQAQIPYIITSGQGFYETEEVLDIITFLAFINNQADDLLLASLLRSPMFGLPDSTILRISRVSREQNLFKKLLIASESEEFSEKFKIHRAVNILNSFLQSTIEVPIPRLINRIVAETAYLGVWHNKQLYNKVKANLNQLVSFAVNFEKKGFNGLYDFIVQFELLSQISREKEASFNTDAEAVKLMTCHASKGLEFPIVIIYEMNSQTGGNNTIQINKDYGISIPFKAVTDENTTIPYKIDVPPRKYVSIMNNYAEYAESKRLLYVATTRAKDHLVLSGLFKLNNDKSFSAKGFAELFQITDEAFTPAELLRMHESGAPLVKKIFSAEQRVYHNGQTSPTPVKFDYEVNFRFESDVPLNQSLIYQKKNEAISKELMLEHLIPDDEQIVFISASKYALFKKSPQSYIDKYILGLEEDPETLELPDTNFIDERNDTPGNIVGLVLHHVFEHLHNWLNEQGVNRDKLYEQCNESARKFYIKNSYIINEIFEQMISVTMQDIFKNNLNKILHAKRELVLNMPYRAGFLTGVVDLLIVNENGEIEIWDWKSNLVNDDEIDELISSYMPQLDFYSYLISRLYPDTQSITCRLIFTNLSMKNDPKWHYAHKIKRQEIESILESIEMEFDEILLL